MKPLLVLCIYLSAFMLLSACAQESGTILAQKELVQEKTEIPVYPDVPAQQFSWITEDGGQSQLDFNPRVDILFVTDNSDSMKTAQANLIKNLNRFTNGITSNKMIDYHIGVISTWDSSERFAKAKKDTYQMGDLRFTKTVAGTDTQERFVTKKDSAAVLANTLKIGIAPYAEGGPEVEEFFSPLTAALQKNGRGAANEDFFRDDAQLVVIFMTDADDSSNITSEQIAQTLIDFKGGNKDKVSVYGVLVDKNDADTNKDFGLRVRPDYHPECFTPDKKKRISGCGPFGPANIEKAIVLANQGNGTEKEIRKKFIMSIISPNFGTELGSMGDSITVKTLAKQIYLSQIPRVDESGKLMLRVRYGTAELLAQGKGQLIANRINGGWTYDNSSNSVKLSGDIKYDYKEGARFAVDLVPIPLAN
ncbi:hypothetical protein [Bdellovibrio sp. GT3]|uniref:hypothetical protein n=1 Tax=Bdellovibrio sp. GT3 TaxID=3136282 RepID=UPI0030F2DCE5